MMKNRVSGRKSSFVEGTFIATLAIIITKFLGILYVIPFYKMVGAKGSALYAYAYTIYVIFLDISTAGLPIAISKVVNEYVTLNENDKKIRTYFIARRIMMIVSIVVFLFMFLFAHNIAEFLIGDLTNGNSVNDATLVIRIISLAILVVPFLSVSKGYLQGHSIINISSISQVIEQLVRILIILGGSYICIYILKTDVVIAISVALLGAFISGLVAYLFVNRRIKTNDDINNYQYQYNKKIDIDIIKKIFIYAIPYIIINSISSLYNFIDMSLLLKTLSYLQYNTELIEFATSSITTWAPKINMIVSSIAMGMSMSLIPAMVSSYTLKRMDHVCNKVNQAIGIILYISIPLCMFIFLFSNHIWNIFYSYNIKGSIILKYSIIYALLINIYMTISTILQGLNKFKIVYILTGIGFLVNGILDVPLMILFNYFKLDAYLGAIVATIIGYSISIIIGLVNLKKECHISYHNTFKNGIKIILVSLIVMFILLLSKYIYNVSVLSKINSIIYVIIEGVLGVILYIYITFKLKIINSIFKRKKLINRDK